MGWASEGRLDEAEEKVRISVEMNVVSSPLFPFTSYDQYSSS